MYTRVKTHRETVFYLSIFSFPRIENVNDNFFCTQPYIFRRLFPQIITSRESVRRAPSIPVACVRQSGAPFTFHRACKIPARSEILIVTRANSVDSRRDNVANLSRGKRFPRACTDTHSLRRDFLRREDNQRGETR